MTGRFGRVAVVLGGLALALLATALPASAHTALKSTTPGKGATVASPAEVELTYTDPVMVPRVIVTDAAGGRHEAGRPRADGGTVSQAIEGTLEPGVYTVGWRVVAADGHPIAGSFTFTVRGAAGTASTPAAAPTPQAPPASAPAATPAAGGSGESSGSGGWLWIGLVALVVAAGAGGATVLRKRTAKG